MSLRPESFDPTHTLLSLPAEDYAPAVEATVEVTLEYATAASLTVDPDELSAGWPTEDEVESAFEKLSGCFERVPASGRPSERGEPEFRGSLPADRDALESFFEYRPDACWTHFVRAIEFERGGDTLLFEVPHHADAALDVGAAADPEGYRREIEEALSGYRACLVPTGTRVEWVGGDRRYRVSGGSLCVETLDGNRASCASLAGLAGIEPDDEALAIDLDWDPSPDDASRVQRAFVGLFRLLGGPPARLDFENPDAYERFVGVLRETIEAYRAE